MLRYSLAGQMHVAREPGNLSMRTYLKSTACSPLTLTWSKDVFFFLVILLCSYFGLSALVVF